MKYKYTYGSRHGLDAIFYQIRKNKTLYFMMLPFLVCFLIFGVYPVLQAIVYSFTDFNILEDPEFVGIRNYKELFVNDSMIALIIVMLDIPTVTMISNISVISANITPPNHI